MADDRHGTRKTMGIAQVGAGVVGGASGRALASRGFRVVFVDVDASVRAGLRAEGHRAVAPEELDPSDVDVFLVSVPTYVEGARGGLAHLEAAARQIGRHLGHLDRYAVVAIRSTVLPGTTEDVVIPLLESCSSRRAGVDFGVCVNPEFLREKSALEDFVRPPVVVIGEHDAHAGALIARLYHWVECRIHHVSLREAEMQKVVHNVFNATKISFFNEVREICELSGVDAKAVFPLVCESAEAMRVPTYGTLDLGPFGGMCLPKDTRAFVAHGDRAGAPARLARAALEVNETFARRALGGRVVA